MALQIKPLQKMIISCFSSHDYASYESQKEFGPLASKDER